MQLVTILLKDDKARRSFLSSFGYDVLWTALFGDATVTKTGIILLLDIAFKPGATTGDPAIVVAPDVLNVITHRLPCVHSDSVVLWFLHTLRLRLDGVFHNLTTCCEAGLLASCTTVLAQWTSASPDVEDALLNIIVTLGAAHSGAAPAADSSE
tara:strand:+ start:121 stop:582 length:462 start_codon:yes stop_codon:yes gene_type:complete